jgi:hypothetical protein
MPVVNEDTGQHWPILNLDDESIIAEVEPAFCCEMKAEMASS